MQTTTMMLAFLRAIEVWFAKRSRSERVTLPVGTVDAQELRQVIRALVVARGCPPDRLE